jgi:hypothetical protein
LNATCPWLLTATGAVCLLPRKSPATATGYFHNASWTKQRMDCIICCSLVVAIVACSNQLQQQSAIPVSTPLGPCIPVV